MPLLRIKRQSSSCLPCTDPIPPCNCTADQTCEQTAQICTQCAVNVCRAISGNSGGASSSLAGSIGGALGGVLGLLAALAFVYFCWWKPRGLAASRKRYSRHISNRQSRALAPEKKDGSSAPPSPGAGADGGAAVVSKRSSVHLRMEGGDTTLYHRPTTPGRDDMDEPSSAGATGARTRENSMSFDLDDPFGDHARSSVGTSDFSFRSSHSTNIIPIAYIPPHSNSISVQDAQRGAYGEILSDNAINGRDRSSGIQRHSIPTSLASRDSRDSLVLAGADGIMLNPLPPVLTPGSPIVPLSASSKGGPIRPPRSPGLDLQLPKSNSSSSPLASPATPGSARTSFPWSAPPPIPSQTAPSSSHFSLATRRSSTNSYLTVAGSAGQRDPRLSDPSMSQNHHLSTLSTISSSSNRSTGSTLSYILDHPQIITPVNPQALRRVEVLGRGQAGLVRIPGSGPPTAAIPLSSAIIPSSASSPTTPKALASQASTFGQQQQMAPRISADPFADDKAILSPSNARFSVGGMTASPSDLAHVRQRSDETVQTGVTTELGPDTATEHRWSVSSAGSEPGPEVSLLAPTPHSDVPQSARNSSVDTGERQRSLTSPERWSGDGVSVAATGGRSESRASLASFASSRGSDSLSMLDGIPFLAPLATMDATGTTDATGSPRFPLPPPRSPSIAPPPSPTVSLGTSSYAPQSDHRNSQYSYDTSYSDNSFAPPPSFQAEPEDDDPLPAPFLPFAGQRPSSNFSAMSRTNSQAISIRSGFGSGLSQIPFQLGFDGVSERGSMMTFDERDRDSMMSYQGGGRGRDHDREDSGMLSGVEEQTEPESRPGSVQSSAEEVSEHLRAMSSIDSMVATPLSTDDNINPFGEHAEVHDIQADPRASTDSMAIALSQELARSLGLDE